MTTNSTMLKKADKHMDSFRSLFTESGKVTPVDNVMGEFLEKLMRLVKEHFYGNLETLGEMFAIGRPGLKIHEWKEVEKGQRWEGELLTESHNHYVKEHYSDVIIEDEPGFRYVSATVEHENFIDGFGDATDFSLAYSVKPNGEEELISVIVGEKKASREGTRMLDRVYGVLKDGDKYYTVKQTRAKGDCRFGKPVGVKADTCMKNVLDMVDRFEGWLDKLAAQTGGVNAWPTMKERWETEW